MKLKFFKNVIEGKILCRLILNWKQLFFWKFKEKGFGNNISIFIVKNCECKFCGIVYEMKKFLCFVVGKKCNKCGRDGYFVKKCVFSLVNYVEDCEIYSYKVIFKLVYVIVFMNNKVEV